MRTQMNLDFIERPSETVGVSSLITNDEIHVSKSTFLNGLANRVHRWFRLTPSFGPELVHEMIDRLGVERDETILDPFAGAGTTLIEAKLEGRKSFGFEINPLLHFVNEACLDWSISPDNLRAELPRLRQACDIAKGSDLECLARRGLVVPPIHNPHRWWRSDVLAELLVLMEAINATVDPSLRRLLRLSFAGVLVPDLTNVTLGKLQLHFIDRSADKIEVWNTFEKHTLQIANDIESLRATPNKGESRCFHQDATKLVGFSEHYKADAVITSPPYPNRYSYVWNTRPHLYMLGLMTNGKEAADLDKKTIGGTWGSATSELAKGIIAPINLAVKEVVLPISEKIRMQDGLMANYVMHYFNRLTAQIMELENVTSPRARLAYVVGNSWIKDVYVETDVMLGEIIDRLGLGYVTSEVHRFRRRHSGKRLYESIVYATKRP
jgi:hypothetical protein